ncbi:hypothetical protein [Methylobacterium aquaticum]|nr:hypothetical protein [Methylobacterium aquaticum]
MALALAIPAAAQAPTNAYQPFQQPTGAQVPPVVILCATGTNRDALPCGSLAAPLNVMSAPFVRASRSPFILPATTTPQQYMVTQPTGSTTYRGYNPCANADVRVMSVAPLEPIVTQPVTVNGKTLPGVLLVTSRTEVIDEFSGTRLGRGPETLGSAANPNGGQDRIISIMLVPIPGYPADLTGVTCLYEHMYGRGS